MCCKEKLPFFGLRKKEDNNVAHGWSFGPVVRVGPLHQLSEPFILFIGLAKHTTT
jgi:hypothetical protein